MTREEIIQIVEEASTRSIIMFLEREDNDTYPNALPSARIVRDNVVFSTQPTMKDGSAADWRMRRSKEDLLEGYTWFSIGAFRGNGTQVDAWTDPVLAKIGRDGAPGANGAPGGDGADGTSIEYIFRLAVDETQFNDFATPYSDPNTTDYVPTVDNGGVPESDAQYGDWADHPDGVTLEHKVEAMCYRKRDIETHQWSEFYGPYKWSVWGNNGRDGDGVEYIFRLATLDGEDAEAEYDTATGIYRLKREYWPPTDQASYDALTPEEKEAYNRTDVEYYPEGWIDDPLDVNDDYPVQFVSIRKYNGEEGKWGFFSEPTCWNKIPLTDSIVTAFTAFSFCITAKDISNYKPVGGVVDDPDPDDFDYQGEHITWHDSIPSSGVGFVWMTTSVWKDGEITREGWSYPMKVNDSPGFQAEYSNTYPWSTTRPKLPNFGDYGENETAWRAAALAAGCGEWKDNWIDDPDDPMSDPTFMATCRKKDGVWTDWTVTKIKGEDGLGSVYLAVDNDNIGLSVDENYNTWGSTSHTIIIEMKMGAELLALTTDNVVFYKQGGTTSDIPQEITFTEAKVSEDGKTYSVRLNVAQGFHITVPFAIGVSATSGPYDAAAVIELIPRHAEDNYVYDITENYRTIIRTFDANGNCVYSPTTLICTGTRAIGTSPAEPYGELKYSVATSRENPKYKIGDQFTEKDGVSNYPTDGINIGSLNNHKNLQMIFVYMIDGTHVVDVENYEIDTRGHYSIDLSTNTIHIKNLQLSTTTINVWVKYAENTADLGGLITGHYLGYYINGQLNTLRECTSRNSTPVTITSLAGFDINTTKSIDFVLRDTNASGPDLARSKTLSFVTDGDDGTPGKNGTSISDTFEYFKAAGADETLTSPDSSHSKSQITGTDGWSISSGGLISETKPMLWSFLRIEYNDNSAKHLPAFVVRYLNPEVEITYEAVKGHVETKIQEDLNNAATRLGKINKTDALINTNKGTGLIELLTSYKDGTKTSFADIIADASKALINQQVGAAIWGESSLKTLTSVGQEINGLDGRVSTHATALFGADGESGLSGAVNDVRSEMNAMEGTLTNTVAKATYILVKGNETFEYAAKDGATKINDGESIDAYNTRMRNAGYEPKVTAKEMSTIKQESNKISLIVGDNNNYLAAIRLLAKAPLKKLSSDGTTWVDVTSPDGSIPEGSRIELDANQIHINGSLLARDIKAIQATIVQLVAGQIKAKSLETGNISSDTGVGAIIQSGKFEVWKAGTKRIEFGVDNQGELVLKFFYASGREAYNLGPAGFNKI